MKSDHPNVLFCPDTPQFPLVSKEAEIHTNKLKYVQNNHAFKQVTCLPAFNLRNMVLKLQKQDDEETETNDEETDEDNHNKDEETHGKERDDEETNNDDKGKGEETDDDEGK